MLALAFVAAPVDVDPPPPTFSRVCHSPHADLEARWTIADMGGTHQPALSETLTIGPKGHKPLLSVTLDRSGDLDRWPINDGTEHLVPGCTADGTLFLDLGSTELSEFRLGLVVRPNGRLGFSARTLEAIRADLALPSGAATVRPPQGRSGLGPHERLALWAVMLDGLEIVDPAPFVDLARRASEEAQRAGDPATCTRIVARIHGLPGAAGLVRSLRQWLAHHPVQQAPGPPGSAGARRVPPHPEP
jgi:hypothetical protein